MYKINEIVQQTGLNERYVRQCVRELKDLFQVKRGVKNSILLDHSALPVFEKIKQEKENGVCFTAIKELLLNTTGWETERDLDQTGEWLGVKDAAKLSKKSEKTIRRLIVTEFKDDPNCLKRDESSQRGKWLINKQFLLNYFIESDHSHKIDDHSQEKINQGQNTIYNHGQDESDHSQSTNSQSQVIELLNKQIEALQNQVDDFKNQIVELKEQLKYQANDFKGQIENLTIDFKEQLSQKDQQIHQLHVLLKESKTSTIDYKPDENLGVFSKVLVKFGL